MSELEGCCKRNILEQGILGASNIDDECSHDEHLYKKKQAYD